MDLNRTIEEIWPQVRRRHLFPELPLPRGIKGEGSVGMDMKGKRILISEAFVSDLGEHLDPKMVVDGLLDHAVSHYIHCPWDFSTHLKLYREAKKVLKNKHMALRATDFFMDVVADTHCVSHKNTHLPEVYRHMRRGPLEGAVHALCQRIWDVDLGVDGHEDLSRKLSRLPYLDRGRWEETARRFANLLRPLLSQEKSRNSGAVHRVDRHPFRQYSRQEIDRGLQELALQVDQPAEFRDFFHDFEKEDLFDSPQGAEHGMGLGPGDPVEADILFYMKLAEHYSLSITKTPMKRCGFLYPHHHVPWEVGKPFHDIDPWTSFGKIMPGITQTWERLEGEALGKEEGIPDCIVLIDSSGSMTNPTRHISYAVLGAACACEAYLRNGAKVAVYNFSDAHAGGRQVLPFSRHRVEIYRTLCRYFGGGTQLIIKDVEGLQTNTTPDVFLITDMQITNLETLIQYFNGCENRVTAVHMGQNKRVQTFTRSMGLRKNVGIFAVQKKEDIPRILLGRIREYMRVAET
jgi:hypothetical protein